jgi:hypothetical protein
VQIQAHGGRQDTGHAGHGNRKKHNMKLYEFFSQPSIDQSSNDSEQPFNVDSPENKDQLEDAIYWSILDDDYLHKKFFLPLASEIKKKNNNNTLDSAEYTPKWMPMVNHGCKSFFKDNQMSGDPKDIFDKQLRIRLCKRISKTFNDDIIKDAYNLGS